MLQPVLIDGEWRNSQGTETFHAINPATREKLEDSFPVSPWEEIEGVIRAADRAFATVREWPGERFASFLEAYATGIEARADDIAEMGNLETALPLSPRLRDVELPRTINQLRQAAAAARTGSWRMPTIDTTVNIRSYLAPIGPVAVFGPNNFPMAFNSIAGGDFAAAVAAGNPVIAKGHPSHPRTTQLFGEVAQKAAEETEMPAGFVQLIYRTSHADGAKLVSHPLLGATGYTGARHAGLTLKEAADKAGNPIYLELSSINPLYILPGALDERQDSIVDEFVTSALMGTGQFCTNPGLVVLKAGESADRFVKAVAEKYSKAPVGTLLGDSTESSLRAGIVALQQAGAEVVVGNQPVENGRCCFSNTLLKASGEAFLANPHGLQAEAFGNATLVITARDEQQMIEITRQLEGNLTGSVYSHTGGVDDAIYDKLVPELRRKVGRLLNDKMPTGVAVSPAMNHGGPYPSTGHPGFTAVGIPAAIRRFGVLQCFDNVRPQRLPDILRDDVEVPGVWRLIDGKWQLG